MDDIRLADVWSDRSAVARWLEAIRADPAFSPTYYPGSLLTEKYPHLRARLGRLKSPRYQVSQERPRSCRIGE